MIRCVAIDDEPLALEQVERLVQRAPGVMLAGSFTSARAAREQLASLKPDLLLLDIDMPGLDGLSLLRSLSPVPLTVITTAHRQHAPEGFDLHVVDYLLKPIPQPRFDEAMKRVALRLRSLVTPPDVHVVLRDGRSHVRVPIARISHVEAYDDHVKVHRDGQRPLVILYTMRGMEELLPSSHFLRIHRSVIVATARISGYNGSHVKLGDLELPISASYREAFQAWARSHGR